VSLSISDAVTPGTECNPEPCLPAPLCPCNIHLTHVSTLAIAWTANTHKHNNTLSFIEVLKWCTELLYQWHGFILGSGLLCWLNWISTCEFGHILQSEHHSLISKPVFLKTIAHINSYLGDKVVVTKLNDHIQLESYQSWRWVFINVHKSGIPYFLYMELFFHSVKISGAFLCIQCFSWINLNIMWYRMLPVTRTLCGGRFGIGLC
jgi:hypothetical protein